MTTGRTKEGREAGQREMLGGKTFAELDDELADITGLRDQLMWCMSELSDVQEVIARCLAGSPTFRVQMTEVARTRINRVKYIIDKIRQAGGEIVADKLRDRIAELANGRDEWRRLAIDGGYTNQRCASLLPGAEPGTHYQCERPMGHPGHCRAGDVRFAGKVGG